MFLLASANDASAAGGDQTGTGLLVTIAARECGSYQDIRANLARNNLMESLQDLGADTLYGAGEPVDPRQEIEGQPKCRPITGWRFTAGSGYQSRAVSGPWGSLSIVTNPDAVNIVTEASTPLLGFHGEPIGNRVVKGATTVELSAAAAERAARNALWLQGGTPSDPILYGEPQFAGKYGFGALRCAIDNLNGDNVETIQFPAGVTHVFCYAYYVIPPPASGTIVIRKETRGAGNEPQSFRFGGNLSYNDGGIFELSAADGQPASSTFYRAETGPGDEPWRVDEEVPEGWKLTEIKCDAGGSQISKNLAAAQVEITLLAADTVTCTYVDELVPPKGAVLIRKTTEGGTGTFAFRILDAKGNPVRKIHLTTTEEGVAAISRPIELDPGTYRVLERSPRNRQGDWHPVSAGCNGNSGTAGEPPDLIITAGKGALCSFANRLVHSGRITIEKETLEGIGTAAFTISPLFDPSIQRHQVAVVKAPGAPVRARGDSTRNLPYGTWVVQEAAGRSQNPIGWSLIETVCNGRPVPFEQGRIMVRLTRAKPKINCRFVDLHTAEGPVVPPEGGPVPGGSEPKLAVEKELVGESEGPAPVMSFRLTVTNNGAAAAESVAVVDSPGTGMTVKSALPSQGACLRLEGLVCNLGSIPAGGQSTVIVKTESPGAVPTVNRAVVGSSSPEATISDDRASVRVIPPKPQPVPENQRGRGHRSACASSLVATASRC